MSFTEAFKKGAEKKLVPVRYLDQALENMRSTQKLINQLFEQRKLPKEGIDDRTIEKLVNELASLDSNNAPHNCGVGEREGRIFSSLVSKRHFGMSHGIGRSGNISEAQPKAAGSSMMSALTNALVLDLIRKRVSKDVVDAFVLPFATGMSLTFAMLSMRQLLPNAKYVLWSRIDQKSCFKSILTANLVPVIVEPIRIEEELQTDVSRFKELILHLGPQSILCIYTTTSCFAPRANDNIEEIGKLCQQFRIYHLVNNAYGIQDEKCSKLIQRAARVGHIDIFVQSTDKNLMVPVGGSIVSGFNLEVLETMKESYPGRGSSSHTLDVFMTLLSMGYDGYCRLIAEKQENYCYLQEKMSLLAQKYNEHVLATPNNETSIAMTLIRLTHTKSPRLVTEVGSYLFRRNISGSRVISLGEKITLGTHTMHGWGSSCSNYPFPYLTAAATIGMKKSHVDCFIRKLEEVMAKAYEVQFPGHNKSERMEDSENEEIDVKVFNI